MAELERQLSLLRYVEAIRLYAALHDGQVARRGVRIHRPAAARSFYRQTLHLFRGRFDRSHQGDAPPEAAKIGGQAVHYSVTIHK